MRRHHSIVRTYHLAEVIGCMGSNGVSDLHCKGRIHEGFYVFNLLR